MGKVLVRSLGTILFFLFFTILSPTFDASFHKLLPLQPASAQYGFTCVDLGCTLNRDPFNQCGGEEHDNCDGSPDRAALATDLLTVEEYFCAGIGLRFMTTNNGCVPPQCGCVAPPPPSPPTLPTPTLPPGVPTPTPPPGIIPTPIPTGQGFFVCDFCFYRGPYPSLNCPLDQPVSCNAPCDARTPWTCFSTTDISGQKCDTDNVAFCATAPTPTPLPPGAPTPTPPGGFGGPGCIPLDKECFGDIGAPCCDPGTCDTVAATGPVCRTPPAPPPNPTAAGCGPEQVATIECLQEKINNSLTWAFALAGIVGLIFVIYAGIKFVTSGGEPEKIQSAKQTLKYVVIGAILLALSYVILWTIAKITGAPIV